MVSQHTPGRARKHRSIVSRSKRRAVDLTSTEGRLPICLRIARWCECWSRARVHSRGQLHSTPPRCRPLFAMPSPLSRSRVFARIFFRFAVPVLGAALTSRASAAEGAEARFTREVQPVLKQYCYDCHGEGSSKGDVSL